jgi:hypothetical protein
MKHISAIFQHQCNIKNPWKTWGSERINPGGLLIVEDIHIQGASGS